ncbi:DUF2339 domain-containing protein [Vannielia litorea]|uniref:DUF2339 domain-containing protein n=1 Tax=Vannielia litorea TaxID=1217970 RepID=UPI001C98B1B6|nr:DUF2339 domain-containing protein [Vannielia litorea]MBY6048019.1 DUF2339 domain-containing protein [Vannielia litorea]MBY6075433.1 DUF2339 domain-containing protein [Vannielia litorea]
MEVVVAFLTLCVIGLLVWLVAVQMGLGRMRRSLDRALREIEGLKRGAEAQRPAAEAAAPPPEERKTARELMDPAATPARAEPEPEEAAPARRKLPWEEGYDPAVDGPAPEAGPVVPRGGGKLVAWLQANWFYAVSALSLALAGLFLVQYGIEQGYLTPVMRVAAALALGAALIGGGEWIRRRQSAGDATAYLPDTFSAAGIVSLYGAVLAARSLYDLIGAGTAMSGLLAVSVGAMLLGWLNGPVLAAFGLIGAGAAPFLVGGEAEGATLFYVYYGLLGVAGLAIDAWRQWRWVSVLALGVAGLGGLAVFAGSGEMPGFAVLLTVLVLAAMAFPRREIGPTHAGGAPLRWLLDKGAGRGGYEVLIAWGAMATASVVLLVLPRDGAAEFLLIEGLYTVLILAVALWAWQAKALSELVLFPALGFLAVIPLESVMGAVLMRETVQVDATGDPLPALPLEASLVLVLAAHGAVAAAWRSLVDGREGVGRAALFWGIFAALFAPLVPLGLELFWLSPRVPGTFGWAGHVLGLAALMVAIAVRFARADGGPARRTAWAVLSAASLIALALFVLLTKEALTVALAVLLVMAAWLDRRFRLREMQVFIALGVIVLGWRVVIDPGLFWSVEASWGAFLLGFGAALGGMAAAWRIMPEAQRTLGRAFLESGLLMIGGIFVTATIWRFIDERVGTDELASHWTMGLTAMVWLLCAAAQVYRMRLGGWLKWLRVVLAAGYTVVSGFFLLIGLTLSNPFLSAGGFSLPDTTVHGPLVFDTLAVAYLGPAVVFALLARIGGRWWRRGGLSAAVGLAGFWVFLEIRRFWQPGGMWYGNGWFDGELYTYTVVLIALGAVLLWQAIAKGSTVLRRAALVVIGLAVVKVFLIDARGLTGLFRVFSFLALGLSLAALAWLNRWAAQEAAERAAGEDGAAEGAEEDRPPE